MRRDASCPEARKLSSRLSDRVATARKRLILPQNRSAWSRVSQSSVSKRGRRFWVGIGRMLATAPRPASAACTPSLPSARSRQQGPIGDRWPAIRRRLKADHAGRLGPIWHRTTHPARSGSEPPQNAAKPLGVIHPPPTVVGRNDWITDRSKSVRSKGATLTSGSPEFKAQQRLFENPVHGHVT